MDATSADRLLAAAQEGRAAMRTRDEDAGNRIERDYPGRRRRGGHDE